MAIDKPWVAWDPDIDFRTLPGAMGVYEIANAEQELLYIGKAGGKSPFGIRGELFRTFAEPEDMADKNWTHPQMAQRLRAVDGTAHYYRFEVNHQYYGRWIEALISHAGRFGTLPSGNLEDAGELPAFIVRRTSSDV